MKKIQELTRYLCFIDLSTHCTLISSRESGARWPNIQHSLLTVWPSLVILKALELFSHLYNGLYLCLCVFMCAHVLVGACVCLCMWGQRSALLQSLHLTFGNRVSDWVWRSPIWLECLPSELSASTCLYSQPTCYTCVFPCLTLTRVLRIQTQVLWLVLQALYWLSCRPGCTMAMLIGTTTKGVSGEWNELMYIEAFRILSYGKCLHVLAPTTILFLFTADILVSWGQNSSSNPLNKI